MAREFAKAFYAGKAWRKCRAAYIAGRKAIDGGMCEGCHERPGYIVHHKVELTPSNINDPDVALNHANLKYDCHICHNREGRGMGRVEGLVGYVFSADGEPVPASPPETGAGRRRQGPQAYLTITHGQPQGGCGMQEGAEGNGTYEKLWGDDERRDY